MAHSKNYVGALAEAIYTFLLDNKGEAYPRYELLSGMSDMLPENCDAEGGFDRAMRLVKVMAAQDGEVVPTPGHYNGNCYMIALPEQANIVFEASVQSGLTAAGNQSVNDQEIEWITRNVKNLSGIDRFLADQLIKTYHRDRKRATEDKRELLDGIAQALRDARAEQKQVA